MTTRRDVLIGIAGVAAAIVAPVKAIAKTVIPAWTDTPFIPSGVYYSGMKVGDILTIEYDGSVWRVVSEAGDLVRAGDLEEGALYTLHLA